MVDALRKAHTLVRPDGRVIDIHPTPEPATVDVVTDRGAERVGLLMEQAEGQEYVDADGAIAEAVARGWLAVEDERTFVFERQAANVHDLVDHIADEWGAAAWLDPVTIARAERAQGAAGRGARVVLAETVGIRRLRPR